MSRIEEALKKAARHRDQTRKPDVGAVEATPVKPVAASPRVEKQNEGGEALLAVEPLRPSSSLVVTTSTERTPAAEEFNKLRAAVVALTRGEPFLNTLLVTSGISEEGKSMTALNLAVSLAKEQDHTVLLVDTDLRRPSLHHYLGISPDKGLVHCLRDNVPISEVLVKTGIGKLVFLPAGEALKDPLDLISSQRMRDIIAELKKRYPERYVIFDSPPALPFADAGVLADMVDSTLIVVREGRAAKEDVRRLVENFKEHHLLGAVYNDTHSFSKKQGYYYYY